MILILSTSANMSTDVMKEIALAAKYRVWIMPIRVEDVNPSGTLEYHLTITQWVDAFPQPIENHLLNIRIAIERMLAEHSTN